VIITLVTVDTNKMLLSKVLLLSLVCVFFFYNNQLNAAEADTNQIHSSSFILMGTIASTHQQPLALIQFEQEKLRFYSLNEKVGPYTLTHILHNKIILSLNEKTYTIPLQQKFNTQPNHNLAESALSELPQQINIKRNLLEHISNNIQQWLNAISLSLEVKDGRISGYIVDSINNPPLNSPIGLEVKDVIKSINGIHVSQAQLFTKMVNTLTDSSDINIQVERGHKLHILNFHISD